MIPARTADHEAAPAAAAEPAGPAGPAGPADVSLAVAPDLCAVFLGAADPLEPRALAALKSVYEAAQADPEFEREVLSLFEPDAIWAARAEYSGGGTPESLSRLRTGRLPCTGEPLLAALLWFSEAPTSLRLPQSGGPVDPNLMRALLTAGRRSLAHLVVPAAALVPVRDLLPSLRALLTFKDTAFPPRLDQLALVCDALAAARTGLLHTLTRPDDLEAYLREQRAAAAPPAPWTARLPASLRHLSLGVSGAAFAAGLGDSVRRCCPALESLELTLRGSDGPGLVADLLRGSAGGPGPAAAFAFGSPAPPFPALRKLYLSNAFLPGELLALLADAAPGLDLLQLSHCTVAAGAADGAQAGEPKAMPAQRPPGRGRLERLTHVSLGWLSGVGAEGLATDLLCNAAPALEYLMLDCDTLWGGMGPMLVRILEGCRARRATASAGLPEPEGRRAMGGLRAWWLPPPLTHLFLSDCVRPETWLPQLAEALAVVGRRLRALTLDLGGGFGGSHRQLAAALGRSCPALEELAVTVGTMRTRPEELDGCVRDLVEGLAGHRALRLLDTMRISLGMSPRGGSLPADMPLSRAAVGAFLADRRREAGWGAAWAVVRAGILAGQERRVGRGGVAARAAPAAPSLASPLGALPFRALQLITGFMPGREAVKLEVL
jgi:hypothetical protein